MFGVYCVLRMFQWEVGILQVCLKAGSFGKGEHLYSKLYGR